MNHIFKKIWNKSLGRMVVVSENAKSAGKTNHTIDKSSHIFAPFVSTSNSVIMVKTLVLSISLSTGMGVWAGEICDGSNATGEQNLGSYSPGPNSFACSFYIESDETHHQ